MAFDDTGGFRKKRQNLIGVSLLFIFICYKYRCDNICEISEKEITIVFTNLSLLVSEAKIVLLIISIYFLFRYFHSFTNRSTENDRGEFQTLKNDLISFLVTKLSIKNFDAFYTIFNSRFKDSKHSSEYTFYKEPIKSEYESLLSSYLYRKPINKAQVFNIKIENSQNHSPKMYRYDFDKDLVFSNIKNLKFILLINTLNFFFKNRLSSTLEFILPLLLWLISIIYFIGTSSINS